MFEVLYQRRNVLIGGAVELADEPERRRADSEEHVVVAFADAFHYRTELKWIPVNREVPIWDVRKQIVMMTAGEALHDMRIVEQQIRLAVEVRQRINGAEPGLVDTGCVLNYAARAA
ncbi:hypothetical protein QYR02_16730 [Microbacterium maritypicum]|uniref:hypothetical protein n=1 Tax=Microbacterium maritypicum TaxID=33918 RepID=UPI00267167BE|nr:hypothetical protein [Microbacterium liquefaciens]WKT89060.1 hypothetical protein QYR02_16730 [Microbacterium liquefaciens]